ncbi:MAG: hypothetical protein LBU99_07300 [Spirochaetaceae bacterium]|jgi:hypothetical protein|nr:hypothetical protein [Spirochaetaceae bacterium]
MKKWHSGGVAVLLFAGMVLFACVLLVSCSGKETEQKALIEEVPDGSSSGVEVTAVVLYDTAAKWKENEQDQMSFSKSSEVGELVSVFMLPNPANPEVLIPEKKEAVRLSDNEKREFYHIKEEGQDYWIQDLFLGVDAVPGIISGDTAFLYTKPDVGAISSKALKLPQFSFAAVHTAESTPDFVCISAYVTEFANKSVEKQYIKRDMVTADTLDLRVFRLYQVAENSKNDTVKRELLNDARSLGSSFNYLVVEALNKLNPVAVSDDLIPFTADPDTDGNDFVTFDEAETEE